jgi:phosphoribosyl-ATP pyrophosphohydrolase
MIVDNDLISKINFEKMNGLIPTIIQDESGDIISLVYSSKESLRKTLESGNGWYFSRERKRLWMKGETSGNIQRVLEIKVDCDRDALLFRVKMKGGGCHMGNYSCFDSANFGIPELYDKIADRIANGDEMSYTKKIAEDKSLLFRKIIEESGELVTAKNKEEIIWEASDLIYFILVLLAKEGITLKDIEKECERRDNG